LDTSIENYAANCVNQALYVQLDWEMSGSVETGSSFSSAFAVIDDTEREPELKSSVSSINAKGAMPETTSASSNNLPTAATATPSSKPSSESSSNGSGSSSSGSGSGGGGLSTGAVVGIAVACGVVALALAGLGVWLLCFRRRRSSPGGRHAALAQGAYAGSDATGGMLAGGGIEKDVPNGGSTDSPHSAYALDRARLHGDAGVDVDGHASRGLMDAGGAAAGAGGAAAVIGSGHARSDSTPAGGYPPYSDRVGTPSGSQAGAMNSQTSLPDALGRGDACPTPPISTRYAHLVEEGMTDDEIRRLEEEERVLDAAIEDAGRSSRAR
jgi:hypothetical protein